MKKKNQKMTKKSRLEHASTIYCRIADSILKESHECDENVENHNK